MTEVLYDTIQSDSTRFVETDLYDVSSLTAGTYTFTNTIESNGDDVLINDNSKTREFVISEYRYRQRQLGYLHGHLLDKGCHHRRLSY